MNKLSFAAAALTAATTTVAHAQSTSEPALPSVSFTAQPEVAASESETPELSAGRLAGEAALGGVFAVGGAVALGGLLAASENCNDDSGDDGFTDMGGLGYGEWCGLGGAMAGAGLGLAFVTPVGVYLAGSAGDQTGSFGWTLAGSLLGTVAGVTGAVGLADTNVSLAGTALVLGPVVGSMIGFNATRKYDSSHGKPRQWMPVASASSDGTQVGVVGQF